MARVYATQADYQQWTGDNAATVAPSVLARASRLIDRALVGAVYVVDSQGLPTDTPITEALRDAVCAQIEWWDETGDTTGIGAASQFASAAIASANYTRAQGAAAGDGKGVTDRLSADALDVLVTAGLLPITPQLRG